mgnify:CR=1 FL=1
MIRYFAGDAVREPEAVECDPPGYPHLDSKGRKQYENTHYDTPDEAWRRIWASAQAGVQLSADTVERLRVETAKAEARLVEDSLRLAYVMAHKPAGREGGE